jgi:hypothetical protein
LLFGLFTGLFHCTVKIQDKVTLCKSLPQRTKAAIAGAVAGLSLAVETRDNRLIFAQQCSMRALQAGYNGLKHRELFHFPLGDSLLFVVSCASIMYAYVQYPQTLPGSMYHFMLRTSRMSKDTLEAARAVSRGESFSIPEYIQNWKSRATPANLTTMNLAHNHAMAALPCSFLHPGGDQCGYYCSKLAKDVFLGIFPVYFALHFVPGLALRPTLVAREYVFEIVFFWSF